MSLVEGDRRTGRTVPANAAPAGANSMSAATIIVTGSVIVLLA
jgi:hypothetical protein